MLNRKYKVAVACTFVIALLVSASAKEKIDHKDSKVLSVQVNSLEKSQTMNEPGHLRTKSPEQIKRDFFRRKQMKSRFEKMQKEREKFLIEQQHKKNKQSGGEDNE